MNEILEILRDTGSGVFNNGWYCSELIDKIAEFRVYVVQGRVVKVDQKFPDDPTQVVWGCAVGGRFQNVRWSEWPLEVCQKSVEVFNLIPNLDFAAVDIMVSRDGKSYVSELNSAPSLDLFQGNVSYSQKCMAKAFKYIYLNGKERIDIEHSNDWRGLIHPAVV